MELEPSIALWRGRGAGGGGSDSALLDVSTTTGKDGSKQVLVTAADEVREFCSQTRQCLNHWSFRTGGPHALRVGAVRHPLSHAVFGICGAPGVGASKKARQARRQEANKTTRLPANEAITVWRDADLEVAKWRRVSLRSTFKAYRLLVHPQLPEEALVVFRDGSFAVFDEDLARVLHSDDAKDLTTSEEEAEDDEEEEGDDEDDDVVWASLDSDHRNPLKGGLFLSLVLKKASSKPIKRYELVIFQVLPPTKARSKGGALSAMQLVRRRVPLPAAAAELGACAFHADTFAYSFVGVSGSWTLLRFTRDALTNALTLLGTQQQPSLASTASTDASVPLHKKRKLQATASGAGYMVCGVGSYSYLVAASHDEPTKLTGWDAKFAVPVASMELNTAAEDAVDADVVVGRSHASASEVGKLLRLVSALNGEVVVAAFERAVFLVQVKNKHSTLASVLGASAHAAAASSAPALPNSSLQWTGVKPTSSQDGDKLDAAGWEASMCSADAQERQLIADLTDPVVTPTAAEFSKRLQDALQKRKAGKAGKRKAGEETEELSFRLLQAVTRRCVASAELGLWEPLDAMLRTRRLSARSEPALLPTLMQHDQFALLESALLHLTDIDERSIVKLLQYFVRKSTDPALAAYVAEQSGKKSARTAAKTDDSAGCERFVLALLALPTNSVFLHRAIRALSLEEVLLLLAVCKKLVLALTTGDDQDEEPAEPTKGSKKSKSADAQDASLALTHFAPLPTASQSCAWMCALLDAHLASLVQRAAREPSVARALRQLDALVQLQLRAGAQYETVQSVLSNFLSGVPLPQAPGLPDYSIEELRM